MGRFWGGWDNRKLKMESEEERKIGGATWKRNEGIEGIMAWSHTSNRRAATDQHPSELFVYLNSYDILLVMFM